MLEQNSLLTEEIPVDNALETLCQTGQQAIGYLDGGANPPAGWKQQSETAVSSFANKRIGDILIQIAPGVAKLVTAVQTP